MKLFVRSTLPEKQSIHNLKSTHSKKVLLVVLSLSVFALVFHSSNVFASRINGGSHFSAGTAGVGGITSVGGDQRNRVDNSGAFQLGSSSHPLNTGCINSPGLFPSASNCASPNVINPAKAPNTAVVQPSNCNVPTSVHTNTPKNIVVHPSTMDCSTHNALHPSNAPNTTVVHPNNCNVPTSVHHTNAPSTVIVHPSNCTPTSTSSSNSLTVNNVQTSNSGSTSSNDSPIANAGPNQNAHPSDKITLDGSKSHDPNGHSLSYSWLQLAGGPVVILSNGNTPKPTFSAPSVTSTTNLTFQLIVNNGNKNSSPSFVSVAVKPQ